MSATKKDSDAAPVELDMAKVRARTRPYDATCHLHTVEQAAAYLEAALEGGDPRLVAAARRNVARKAGLGYEEGPL